MKHLGLPSTVSLELDREVWYLDLASSAIESCLVVHFNILSSVHCHRNSFIYIYFAYGPTIAIISLATVILISVHIFNVSCLCRTTNGLLSGESRS